jgi:hypothetical protein
MRVARHALLMLAVIVAVQPAPAPAKLGLGAQPPRRGDAVGDRGRWLVGRIRLDPVVLACVEGIADAAKHADVLRRSASGEEREHAGRNYDLTPYHACAQDAGRHR